MVTVLAGVIAVLGTSILFLSGDSLTSLFGDIGKTFGSSTDGAANQNGSIQTSQEQSSSSTETLEEGQPAEVAEQPAIECEALDVSGDYPVLQDGEECFSVSNMHTWVNKISGRINERSTTAFVVENTGTKAITIDSITLSDVPVPASKWFFTTDPSVVKLANVQNDLPVDYTETAVAIGGGIVFMKSGALTLEPGQRAIVYLDEAGGVVEKDIGLALTLQVKSGMIQVEKAVLVVRA
jgi:hypothetical protein